MTRVLQTKTGKIASITSIKNRIDNRHIYGQTCVYTSPPRGANLIIPTVKLYMRMHISLQEYS